MNFCIYSPYIPKHFGGGEKYLLSVAKVMATLGNVEIAVSRKRQISEKDNQELRKKYSDFIGEELSEKINFVSTPLGTSTNFFSKLRWTMRYDVMYYATDGSLFFSLAGRNILHIQIPFTNKMRSPISRLKLANWKVKNTNSEFTKNIIESSWKANVNYVHYPVIVEEGHKASYEGKENIILNVGRFFTQMHSKRQDILVEIFRSLMVKINFFDKKTSDKNSIGNKNWRLVLIGSVEDEEYLKKVKKATKGLPIEIYTDVSRKDLLDWYKKAKIYWHATGYGVDESEHPEKVEHFGISVIEAMSFGCAPVLIKKGGLKEILSGSLERWLWDSRGDCVSKTLELIADPHLLRKTGEQAGKRAREFDSQKFEQVLLKMIYE